MANRLITLLSDFGYQDVYVAVMKAVIACINEELKIIDLTHQIPPQNLAAARFCLLSAYQYFPAETVHIAVVDPGVGGSRRGVAIQFEGGFLVGPDNGIFSGILSQKNAIAAVELTNQKYWMTPAPSATFHGRDIFGPVGAYLASGVPLKDLGKVIDCSSLIQLPFTPCSQKQQEILGSVQYIDNFGNLITNIPENSLKNKDFVTVIKGREIVKKNTYNDVEKNNILALIDSHGWLEIAVNSGNAAQVLQVSLGETVKIVLK